MWGQEFIWFFAIFHQEFRKNNPIAFEVLMVLAVANLFGFYNPKQLADFGKFHSPDNRPLSLCSSSIMVEVAPQPHQRRN